MFRLLVSVILFVCYFSPFSLFAGEGYIGENPGLNFYSRIDETAGTITDGLVKKRLSEYSTFARFGRYCRTPSSWLDTERMDRRILNEIWNGYYGSLVNIAARKRITLSGESLQNLSECLRDAYGQVQKGALAQYESLSSMGSMGLYMDGDTNNSDYDIISDIEKINGLIFTEDLRYEGTRNEGKTSLANLLAGKLVTPLISPSTRAELSAINGTSGSTLSGNVTETNTTGSTTNITLGNLGIGTICSVGTGTVAVENMADDAFLQELDEALLGNTTDRIYGGGTYSPRDRVGSNSGTLSGSSNNTATSNSDVFQNPRCESIFCITVKMVSGSNNLLGGGKNVSIESMLDKHITTLEPISWTDLGLQKMTNNIIQVPYTGLSLKLKAKVKGGGMFIGQKPPLKENYKKDETKAEKDRQFEQIRRCAVYSAGFTSADPNIANSIMGAGYITRIGESLITKDNTAIPIAPTNPEDIVALKGCQDLAVEKGRQTYYESFGDDLSEFQTFTNALVQEIGDMLDAGKKIDTLKVE